MSTARAVIVTDLADRYSIAGDIESQRWLFDMPALQEMLGEVIEKTRQYMPPTTVFALRAEFEAWISSLPEFMNKDLTRPEGFNYQSQPVRNRWIGFQAARGVYVPPEFATANPGATQ